MTDRTVFTRNRGRRSSDLATRLLRVSLLVLLLSSIPTGIALGQAGNEAWQSGYSSPDMPWSTIVESDGGTGFVMALCQAIPGDFGQGGQSPIAHWTGQEWIFPPGPCPTNVHAVARSGTNYYVAADSFSLSPSITGLARLSSGQWQSPWATPLVGQIDALSVDSLNNMYLGGTFSSIDGDPVSNIAYLDTDDSVLELFDQGGQVAGTNGSVLGLLNTGSQVYAVGTFTAGGGAAASGVARWTRGNPNGSWLGYTGLAMTPGAPNRVSLSGNDIWVAGGMNDASFTGIAFWDDSAGIWKSPGDPGLINSVSDVHVTGGNRVLAMGDFSAFGDPDTAVLGEWFQNTWVSLAGMEDAYDTKTPSGSTGRILSRLADTYVFSSHDPATDPRPVFHGGITRFDGLKWIGLGQGFGGRFVNGSAGVNDYVDAVGSHGGKIFVGGRFANAGDAAADGLAYWNNDDWEIPGAGLEKTTGLKDTTVRDFAELEGSLYAGGCFDTSGTTPALNVARFDGLNWHAVGGGIDLGTANCLGALLPGGYHLGTGIWDLEVHSNQLYAAGSPLTNNFNSHLYHLSQGSWSVVGGGTNSHVTALASLGATLYVAGSFTAVNNSQLAAGHIASWNGSSWSTLAGGMATGFNTAVNDLAVTGASLYAGGLFQAAGGTSANNIARWDGSQWHALGTGVNGEVFSVLVVGGDLYVGGNFTEAGGKSARGIARWDGSEWHPLGWGLMNPNGLELFHQGDQLWVGGNFDFAGDKPANDIAVYRTGFLAFADGFESSGFGAWSMVRP